VKLAALLREQKIPNTIYRITSCLVFFSGNLILALLAVVLVTLKIIIHYQHELTFWQQNLRSLKKKKKKKKNHAKITSPD
jgi:Ca2+-dependent lipid-binding protein